MGVLHREDSIVGIRRRDAQKTKIATSATLVDGSIVLQLPEGGVCTGTTVKFNAPCDCTHVTGGITIDGNVYTVVDASGACVTGIGGVWVSGAEIAVVMDCEKREAYILNASMAGIKDTMNAHFNDKTNPHDVDATQVYVSENCVEHNELPSPCNVDNALMDLKSQIDTVRDRFSAVSGMTAWKMYKKGIVYTDAEVKFESYYSGSPLMDVTYEVSNEIAIVDGKITLVKPTEHTLRWSIEENPNGPIDQAWAYDEPMIPAGAYVTINAYYHGYSTAISGRVYRASKNAYISGYGNSHATDDGWSSTVTANNLQLATYTDIFAGRVTDSNPDAYPNNGMVGDTLYIKDGNPYALIPSMEMGTYSGVGKSGFNGTNALSFLIKPHLVIVTGSSGKQAMFVRGSQKSGDISINWGENDLQWTAANAAAQLNTLDEVYSYVAIGQEVKAE